MLSTYLAVFVAEMPLIQQDLFKRPTVRSNHALYVWVAVRH